MANCVAMRLLIEFYQLWYLGLALPVIWYGPGCALIYSGAWGGGVFVPTALAFGLFGRAHGIFAASVFVVVPLSVMCLAVARGVGAGLSRL